MRFGTNAAAVDAPDAWHRYDLDAACSAEDIDAAVDAALDDDAAAGADPAAPDRLAAVLGVDAAAFRRLVGGPVAPEVAAVRLTLIAAADAACRARAAGGGAAFVHALAVAAALRFEAFGDAAASVAAMALARDYGK